jgi:hypothetical protein
VFRRAVVDSTGLKSSAASRSTAQTRVQQQQLAIRRATTMQRVIFGLLVLTVIVATQQAPAAVVISLFNTGVDASGTPLADDTIGDPHYVLVSPPPPTTGIRVRTSAGGFPIPPYIGDDSSSAWIGSNFDHILDGNFGPFDYQTTFSLTGFLPSTAVITGAWTSDNEGVAILLNGVDTGIPPTAFNQFELGFVPFSISSGFLPGLNTLDFIVNNGGGPTALRVEMTASADADTGGTVPEATSVLIWLPVVGFAGWIARKKLKD